MSTYELKTETLFMNYNTSMENFIEFNNKKSPPKKGKPLEENKVQHVPCKFYRNGACTAGKNCIFSHQKDTPIDSQLCKYYFKGNCKFGNKCALSHGAADNKKKNKNKNYIEKNNFGIDNYNQMVFNHYDQELLNQFNRLEYTNYDLYTGYYSPQVTTINNYDNPLSKFTSFSPPNIKPVTLSATQSLSTDFKGLKEDNIVFNKRINIFEKDNTSSLSSFKEFSLQGQPNFSEEISANKPSKMNFDLQLDFKNFSPFKEKSFNDEGILGSSLPAGSSLGISNKEKKTEIFSSEEEILSQSFQQEESFSRISNLSFSKDLECEDVDRENQRLDMLFDDEDVPFPIEGDFN